MALLNQTVTYTLDATDRLIGRVASGTGTGSENTTTVYGYTGTGDTADLQLNGSNALAERYLSLPGGVLLTRRYLTSGGDVWSIPNIHGDIIATTDASGAITGSGFLTDPFGGPIDPTTGSSNLSATPTTRTNGLTDGWEGEHQRAYEHTGGLNDTLMGARLYLPAWGQFTSTDPVPGGTANPYTYPNDPINQADLNGEWGLPKWVKKHMSGIVAIASVGSFIPVVGVGFAAVAVAGSAYMASDDFKHGHYGSGLLNSVGAVAGVGALATGVRAARAASAFRTANAEYRGATAVARNASQHYASLARSARATAASWRRADTRLSLYGLGSYALGRFRH